ncbi:hypothetical protein AB0K16_39330 [Nonomuraea jabiensis]|uniref:hypothetical protein n=1 Tax=Nonomuraea jabiensis TaxID=882448 RepID=UPI003430D7B4
MSLLGITRESTRLHPAAAAGVKAGVGAGWLGGKLGRVKGDKQPSGGKTLGLILLGMLVILAVIVGLAVWASRTG